MLCILVTGELRHISKLRYWPLRSVLREKYILPPDQADLISSFLLPMLRLEPERRAKAGELIHHAWLDGIVVRGELEQLWSMEEGDRERNKENFGAAEGAGAHGRVEGGEMNGVPFGELDAMKPADDPHDAIVKEQEEKEKELERQRQQAAAAAASQGHSRKNKGKKGKK